MLFNSAADVRAYLKGGKDPNERYGNGMTLLHRVARDGNPEVIRALLARTLMRETSIATPRCTRRHASTRIQRLSGLY